MVPRSSNGTIQARGTSDGTYPAGAGGSIRINGGTLLGNGTITVAGGTVAYAAGSSQTVFTRINATTAFSYYNLTIDNTGAAVATQEGALLDVDNNFVINGSDAEFTAAVS